MVSRRFFFLSWMVGAIAETISSGGEKALSWGEKVVLDHVNLMIGNGWVTYPLWSPMVSSTYRV